MSAWTVLPSMPRWMFQDDEVHSKHHEAHGYPLNAYSILFIADASISVFNTITNTYHHVASIPFYNNKNNDYPSYINAINISTARADDNYHFILFRSYDITKLDMYELVIDRQSIESMDNTNPNCKVKVEWINVKSLYMDKDKHISIHRTHLVSDLYHPEWIYLFRLEFDTESFVQCAFVTAFNVQSNEMITKKIHDQQFFMHKVVCLNNYTFLYFGDSIQILTFDPIGDKFELKQATFSGTAPSRIGAYFRYSNYVIQFCAKWQFGDAEEDTFENKLLIYDWVHCEIYESKTTDIESIQSFSDVVILSSGFAHCIGGTSLRRLLNVKLILDELGLLHPSKIPPIIDHWFRSTNTDILWVQTLSASITNYVCAPP